MIDPKQAAVCLTRDDGRTFSAVGSADAADWGLSDISGLDAPDFQVSTQDNAVGDGQTVTAKRVSSREISFTASCRNAALGDVMRRAAVSFFSPKHRYKLTVAYRGAQRWIDAELSAFSCPSGNVYRTVELTALLLCPDPYFRSMDEFGRDIASVQGRFGFPYVDHPVKGFVAAAYNFARTVLIDNDGDVDTFATAVFEATGDVANPELIIGGAHVRILDTMAARDVVTIDLARTRVTKNGANILARVDRASSFTGMRFAPGQNTVKYAASVGENVLRVTLYYNKLYLGV